MTSFNDELDRLVKEGYKDWIGCNGSTPFAIVKLYKYLVGKRRQWAKDERKEKSKTSANVWWQTRDGSSIRRKLTFVESNNIYVL